MSMLSKINATKLRINKYALMLLCYVFVSSSYAGTGFYIRFINNTSETITLNPGGNDMWYPNQLGYTNDIKAHGQITLYTEAVQHTNITDGTKPGICGVDVIGGKYNNGHIEIWSTTHEFTVSQNIHGVWDTWSLFNIGPFYIGTNNIGITTTFDLGHEGSFDTGTASVTFN